MGMRSIVGRLLILAVLLASLGVIAQAAIKISQASGKTVAKASPVPPAEVASLAASPAPAAPVQAAPVQAPPVPTPAALDAPAPAVAPSSIAPAAGAPAPQPAADAPIRVVYPGPLGDSAPPPPRKIADAAPASPLPAATATQPAPSVSTPVPTTEAAPAAKPPAAAVVASLDAPAAASAEPAASGKGGVDLNSASVDALNRLGGGHIGQSIVQHRPYRSVEDLVKKRVIRRSVYEQIKAQVAAR